MSNNSFFIDDVATANIMAVELANFLAFVEIVRGAMAVELPDEQARMNPYHVYFNAYANYNDNADSEGILPFTHDDCIVTRGKEMPIYAWGQSGRVIADIESTDGRKRDVRVHINPRQAKEAFLTVSPNAKTAGISEKDEKKIQRMTERLSVLAKEKGMDLRYE